MRRRLLSIILVILAAVVILSGCGGTKSSNSKADYAEQTFAGSSSSKVTFGEPADGGVQETTAAAATMAEASKGSADAVSGGTDVSQSVSNAILSERKVIRSANVTVEVKDFDEAYNEINNMILGIGFIQSTNINSEKYSYDGVEKLIRRGSIVIRVDREKFDRILSSVKGIGDVMNWNINGEDVTDKYFDTESRLRLLRIEEGKLEEYLKRINDLDQIFKTESRLTDIRYQIEALTGNLKKMGDLVELSTISINVNEKYPDAPAKPKKPESYWQKVIDSFVNSTKGVADFLGELLMFLVSAIPVLVLLGVLTVPAVAVYRRISRKSRVKTNLNVKNEDIEK